MGRWKANGRKGGGHDASGVVISAGQIQLFHHQQQPSSGSGIVPSAPPLPPNADGYYLLAAPASPCTSTSTVFCSLSTAGFGSPTARTDAARSDFAVVNSGAFGDDGYPIYEQLDTPFDNDVLPLRTGDGRHRQRQDHQRRVANSQSVQSLAAGLLGPLQRPSASRSRVTKKKNLKSSQSIPAFPNSTAAATGVASSVSLPAIGRRAARFEISSLKWKRKDPQKLLRRPFNPIVLTRRRCTDPCCSLLFVVFLVGWLGVAFFAMMMGKPERLIHPTDSRGRICGYDRPNAYNLSLKPYLLFFDLTKCASYVTVLTGCPTKQVCVERCPTEYFSYLQLQKPTSPWQFREDVQRKVVCDESVDKAQIGSFSQLKQLVDRGLCAAYTVNSAAVLGRCMPRIFLDMTDALKKVDAPSQRRPPTAGGLITGSVVRDSQQFLTAPRESLNWLIKTLGNANGSVPTDQQLVDSRRVVGAVANSNPVLQKVAADLYVSWWQILTLLAVAAAVSLAWTLMMRVLGGMMIWASIVALLSMLAAGAVICWLRFKQLVEEGAVNDYSFQPMIDVYFEMPNTWMAFAISLSVLFVLSFITFLIIRTRVRLAVALVEETCKALGNMLSTLFFPIISFLLHIVVFALWGTVTISLSSSGEENCRRSPRGGWMSDPADLENGEPCDCQLLGTTNEPNCRYVNITRETDRILAMQAYNLFAFFWMSGFVSALADMTIAGAFASHYFAFRKPQDVPSFPVFSSLGRAIRYHVGTLAFGSLVLSLVRFAQVILDFLYNRFKAAQNPVAKFIYRALSCLFYCMEVCLRFLSKNAYIMTAIYGKGFCRSSRDSFNLLTRNIVRVVVLNRTTAFLLFVGKASITCAMGIVSFYYFSGRWVINGLPHITLYYYFVPIGVVIVGTFFVCDLFFQVYDMGVDATFLCFLEDSEANDGSVEKPFYMSDTLKKILGKENKF